MGKIEVKKIASTIDRPVAQKKIMEALGLNKMNSVRVHNDTPQIRGMVEKVKHLVSVKEIN